MKAITIDDRREGRREIELLAEHGNAAAAQLLASERELRPGEGPEPTMPPQVRRQLVVPSCPMGVSALTCRRSGSCSWPPRPLRPPSHVVEVAACRVRVIY
eukprot:6288377-Pyramimonas_sp.AAC.1